MDSISGEPSFKRKHSAFIRLWHWSVFVVIGGSLTTVLFAKTIFNTKGNIQMVQENLQKSNVTVNSDQAKSVAHEFNDKIWHWHIYLGYVLASLFFLRLVYELVAPTDQKLIPLVKKAIAYLKLPTANKEHAKHYLLVKCLYLLFYTLLLTEACTGLFMAYSDDIPALKTWRHYASNIHAAVMWIVIGYIVIHISGVILAELSKKSRGIISGMINGGEDV